MFRLSERTRVGLMLAAPVVLGVTLLGLVLYMEFWKN